MKLNNLVKAILITSTFSLTSCATIFTGTKDYISFTSNVDGAKVYENGVERCSIPCGYNVSRSLNEKTVEVKKTGYETKILALSSEFNPVSILNLFGLVGWAVDAATGSLKKYDTKVYNVELETKK